MMQRSNTCLHVYEEETVLVKSLHEKLFNNKNALSMAGYKAPTPECAMLA